MKLKQLLIIGNFVMLTSHGASAQTVIRIVASNGDRTATQTAIKNILNPGWTFQGTSGDTNSGSPSTVKKATDSNFGAWNGTFGAANDPVIIKVSFAGALAGVAAVAGNTPQRFVVSNGTGTGSVPNPLTGTTLGVDYEIGTANFGFSTNFQATSPFNGTYQGVTYNSVIEENVGVSPLGFYASPGFPVSGANITTQLAQLLYTTGSVPLALFTGDFVNDSNKIVWAIGRNTDAGQRFGAYAEIGLGTAATVTVWKPNFTVGTGAAAQSTYGTYIAGGVVGSHALWPAETISNIFSPLGSGGFSSGALVAQHLTVTLGPDAYKGKFLDEENHVQYTYPDAVAGYYVGYVTPGDANNRVLGLDGVIPAQHRGIALSYNGVALTTENVKNGKYTAWLYNRILKPQGGVAGAIPSAIADALRDRIRDFDAPAGGGIIDDATFKVQRFTDGGLVTPK